MNRQKVVELQIELKHIIKLNEESIKLQEKRKNKEMIAYLKGFSDAYECVYKKLSHEC